MQPIRALAALVVTLAVLAACGGEGARPTATAVPATQPPATATTATAATPTPGSTATSVATVAPTPTSESTTAPTATSAPTAIPSPTPVPTPVPDPVVYSDIIFGDLVVDRGGEYPEGVGGIFAIDADGSDLHQITNTPEGWGDTWPSVSPDGMRVAFIRSRGGLTEEQGAEGGVYVVDIATGEERWIVNGRAVAVWSPDGSRLLLRWQEHSYGLACCGGGNEDADPPKIAVVNPDGSDQQVLYDSADDDELVQYLSWEPIWSPDGSRVLFTRWSYREDGEQYGALTVVDADGSDLHDVDTGPITPNGAFQWSPDGATIAFVGTEQPFPDPGLFSVATDGSRLTRLTTPDVAVAGFAYAPDGSAIAFDGTWINPRSADYRYSVYLIAPDGSGLRQLTSSDVSAGLIGYSPDGTKIAARTWDPGTERSGLFVMNADGGNAVTIDVPQSGGYGMDWSSDSTRLVYLAFPDYTDKANQLRVIDVRAGTLSPTLALVRYGEGVIQPVWRLSGE